SALTGGSGPATRFVAPQAVSRQAAASAIVKAVAPAERQRHAQPLASIAAVAVTPKIEGETVSPSEPLFAGRRRE
ncbi:hypothetical protein ACO1NJ_14200, partial [Staphylococcus aureus]